MKIGLLVEGNKYRWKPSQASVQITKSNLMLTNLQYLGILNLNNFSFPLSYRNSTDTQILKNKLRIEIGAMCAINKSSQLVNSKCAEIMNIGYMA